jgi:excisionase family DNA binding protein
MAMSNTIDGIEYLDGDEAVALLRVKKATLYAYVSRGVLRSYKQAVGRNRLYRRDEVERLLAIQSRGQGAAVKGADLPDVASWAGDH